MDPAITRRTFLKQTGLVAAALPLLETPAQGFFQNAEPLSLQKSFTVPTICSQCPSRCQMLARISHKKAIKLEGNPQSPLNGGKICAIGHAALKLLYDPDRLKYPLKRIGLRGEGRWARISWDEAIDTIALRFEQTLRQTGPDGVALFAKGPSAAYIRELCAELKISQVIDAATETCHRPRELAYTMTFGAMPATAEQMDFSKTGCVVLIGSHLGENIQAPKMIRELLAARERGLKLIVVDPRLSVIAAKADYHLMIRPGTDTALLLGWINHLIVSQRYDQTLVAEQGEGFTALREQAANYSLERVAGLTDIPTDLLLKTAELLAATGPATIIYPGSHSSWYGNDVQRLRAQAILTGLLGSWGAAGGIWPRPSFSAPAGLRQGESGKPEQKTASGLGLLKKIERQEIKMIGCWGQNPCQAYPNPYRTIAALKKAEFIFVCDVLPTEPALYADIILPEATFLERTDILESYDAGGSQKMIALRYPVVEPCFEARDPYWIVKQLSSRLGFMGSGFSADQVESRIDAELKPYDLSVAALLEAGGISLLPEKDEPGPALSYPTPSGKIEFYSSSLKQLGHAPLPDFTPVPLPPPGFQRLLYGRSPVHAGSFTNNNPWLNHEFEENELWLNDKVAEAMGIKAEERLFLENQDGIRSIHPIKIKITPGIRTDCVYMAHGFGVRSPHLRQGYNRGVADGSLLTRTAVDPISGSHGMRLNFVRFLRNGVPLQAPVFDHPPLELQEGHLKRIS